MVLKPLPPGVGNWEVQKGRRKATEHGRGREKGGETQNVTPLLWSFSEGESSGDQDRLLPNTGGRKGYCGAQLKPARNLLKNKEKGKELRTEGYTPSGSDPFKKRGS